MQKKKEHKAALRESKHATKKKVRSFIRITKDNMWMIAGVCGCVVWQLMESRFMMKDDWRAALK